jgi:hypothetical protein
MICVIMLLKLARRGESSGRPRERKSGKHEQQGSKDMGCESISQEISKIPFKLVEGIEEKVLDFIHCSGVVCSGFDKLFRDNRSTLYE